MVLPLTSVPLDVSIDLESSLLLRAIELDQHLGTERSKRELGLTTLGELNLFLVKHPLIRGESEVLTVDHKSQISELILVLALNKVLGSRDAHLLHLSGSKGWHGSKRGTRVKGNQALVGSSLADIERLSSNLNIIERHTEHILELNWRPVDVSGELSFIVVTKSQIRL